MYELVSFVSRGKIRRKILLNLDKPMTPTQLSQKIKTHRSTTSRSLLILEKKGIVKCITPKENMGRYYDITDVGRNIFKIIDKEKK